MADAFWGQTGYPWLDSYLDTLALNHDPSVYELDCGPDSPAHLDSFTPPWIRVFVFIVYVPFQFVGEQVDVRATWSTVEVLHNPNHSDVEQVGATLQGCFGLHALPSRLSSVGTDREHPQGYAFDWTAVMLVPPVTLVLVFIGLSELPVVRQPLSCGTESNVTQAVEKVCCSGAEAGWSPATPGASKMQALRPGSDKVAHFRRRRPRGTDATPLILPPCGSACDAIPLPAVPGGRLKPAVPVAD